MNRSPHDKACRLARIFDSDVIHVNCRTLTMTKFEGIGHPLKIETIEDFGPSFVPDVLEPVNMAWSIAVFEPATKFCRSLVSSAQLNPQKTCRSQSCSCSRSGARIPFESRWEVTWNWFGRRSIVVFGLFEHSTSTASAEHEHDEEQLFSGA